jgi:hypothetical protein
VHLAYHWVKGETGDIVVFDGMRSELLSVIEHWHSRRKVNGSLRTANRGAYLLLLPLVQENLRWFYRANPKVVCEQAITIHTLMEVNFPSHGVLLLLKTT